MNLIIDNREHALIESCQKYLTNVGNDTNINIQVETLDLADVIIKRTSDAREVLYIERKTIADLLASIKDGRYEEQSFRLTNASGMPAHHIMYIVEGFLSSVSASEKKLVLSTLTSLNIFKGFSIMKTANVHETAELIICMTAKIGRDLEKGRIPIYLPCNQTSSEDDCTPTEVVSSSSSYSTVVKKVKKENLTPENMAEIVLCQIPGISTKTASAIIMQKKPGSLFELLKCMENDSDYLRDVVLENGRKMNKNCYEKISKFVIKHSTSLSDTS
jgi:ERCC4-type nuclease